jgi:hypothetical protein
VHPTTLARMLERATACLNVGRLDEARQVVANIPLPPVTFDSDALMRAVSQRLGVKIPAVAVAGYPSSTPPQLIQQLAGVYDTKLAAAVMLEAAFNPELRRVAPGAAPFDPALHPRWPRGRSDGGQFRPRDDAGGSFVPVRDRRGPAPVSLPRGNYRPELQSLVERIVNAAPDEAMALHHEIEEHYGQFGDGFAAAVLHRALSEVLQPGATVEDRQRIADRVAFLADRNPERIGALEDALGAIVLGQRGIGARVESLAPSEAPEVPPQKWPLDIPSARPTGRGEVSRWGRRIADALGDAIKNGDTDAANDIERSLAEATWLDSEVANIRSAQDPPRSLDELKARAREKGPHPGYDDHLKWTPWLGPLDWFLNWKLGRSDLLNPSRD